MDVLRSVLSTRCSRRVHLTSHSTTLRRTNNRPWCTNPNRLLSRDSEPLRLNLMPRLPRCNTPTLPRELGSLLVRVSSGIPCQVGRHRRGLRLKVSREVLQDFSISRRLLGPFQSQLLHLLHRRNPLGDLSMPLVNLASRCERPLGHRGLPRRHRILAATHEIREIRETQGMCETPGMSDTPWVVFARPLLLAIPATTATPFSILNSGRCLTLGWSIPGWRPSSVTPVTSVTRGTIRVTIHVMIRAMTLGSTLGTLATTLA